MRHVMVSVLIAAASAGLGGCGGGGSAGTTCLAGDPHCGLVITGYSLETSQLLFQSTPLAMGASTSYTFTEKRCTGSGSQSPLPPGVHLGCDPSFLPTTLTVTVTPISNGGGPCGIAGTVTGPGVVTFTRTGPGDPRLGVPSGQTGFCFINVSDPTRNDGEGGHPSIGLML